MVVGRVCGRWVVLLVVITVYVDIVWSVLDMPFDLKPYDVDVETLPYLDGKPESGDRWTLNFWASAPCDAYDVAYCV